MLFAAQTWPFTVATFLMLLIAVVEGLALLIGGSISESLQDFLPDPGDIHGPFDKFLGWLYVGRVPILALLVVFLASFALSGFVINMITQHSLGFWVPTLISIPVALAISLPSVRFIGGGLAKLIPTDQTFAVSFDSLVGRVATIVNGTARLGYPAQAKVSSEHGQTLYVQVEPHVEGTTFQSGDRVLLTRQITGNRFACEANPWPDLI